ncbi:MAG: prolyl oligopeptidase family serine peptidase, partial [Bacteroidaceae bacterium]|nr:prolyl oligopeptidase family serine peptidase [Bacteroidaceae bacterium]
QKHPSFVLVPQYTDWAVQDDWSTTDGVEMTIRLLEKVCKEYNVDTNRLYTTGQSMGGMMSFYFNITHPDLFAASLFVSSQWDTSKMQDFGRKHFFYIVAGGDQKAYGGMSGLAKVLKEQNVRIDSASWSAKLPSQEQERLAEELIAKGNSINFITFDKGTVLPESGKGMEHMASFDYGYKIAAVRDWLFRQSK